MNNILRDYKTVMFDASFRVSEMVDKELNDMQKRNKFRFLYHSVYYKTLYYILGKKQL